MVSKWIGAPEKGLGSALCACVLRGRVGHQKGREEAGGVALLMATRWRRACWPHLLGGLRRHVAVCDLANLEPNHCPHWGDEFAGGLRGTV